MNLRWLNRPKMKYEYVNVQLVEATKLIRKLQEEIVELKK